MPVTVGTDKAVPHHILYCQQKGQPGFLLSDMAPGAVTNGEVNIKKARIKNVTYWL